MAHGMAVESVPHVADDGRAPLAEPEICKDQLSIDQLLFRAETGQETEQPG